MVRTQIQLTEEQSRMIKAAAARDGISISAVIRRCVDKDSTLANRLADDAEIRRRAIEAIGCCRSGLGDLSERHDDYLDEIYSE